MLIDFLNNLLTLMNNMSNIQLDVVNIFLATFAGLSALTAILGFYFSRKDIEKEREFARENLIIQLNYHETKKIVSYFNNELRDIYNVYYELKESNNKLLLSSKDYLILMYLIKIFRKLTNPYMPKNILDSWKDFWMKKPREVSDINIEEFFEILDNTENNKSKIEKFEEYGLYMKHISQIKECFDNPSYKSIFEDSFKLISGTKNIEEEILDLFDEISVISKEKEIESIILESTSINRE